MAGIDLSHLETPELAPFVVQLPDGEVQLRPIVALPTEGERAMLRISGLLSDLDPEDHSLSSVARTLADALEDVDALLKAACPSKTAESKLMTTLQGHLTEKIQLVVAYIGQEQAGEASASAG